MQFKLNDHVRVKPGVLLEETGEPVPGWQGQITEVPTDPNDDWVYLVELDAPSLEQLPEKYLADCIENEKIPVAYYFGEDDLEPAPRRDTEKQRSAAQERVENLIIPLEDDELDNTQLEQWLDEFEQSNHFAVLQQGVQESARSIVEMFSQYAFNYRGDQPAEWTTGTVREVCLELFPRKFTAELEYFEQIGPALGRFFGFLAENKYQKNAAALRREAETIAPEIIRQAKNPRNWGMAKSFAMQAIDAGVNFTDERAMEGFIANYNDNLLGNMDWPEAGSNKPDRLRPAQQNPFKNISRNEVVKVKYPDGSIREGKFKRLEEDLRAGKCELLL